jgi:hypothetical protein
MKPVNLIDAAEGKDDVIAACKAQGLDATVLRALVAAVRSREGQLRRRGLFDQFDSLLGLGDPSDSA